MLSIMSGCNKVSIYFSIILMAKKPLSFFFRRLAFRTLLAFSGDMEPHKYPLLFKMLHDFLKDTKDSDLESHKMENDVVPLVLSKSREKEASVFFQKEFPQRFHSGISGMPVLSYLYMIGQALLIIPTHVQLIEMTYPAKAPRLKAELQKLKAIWGTLNARGLEHHFSNKPNEQAKPELLQMLKDSITPAEELAKVMHDFE